MKLWKQIRSLWAKPAPAGPVRSTEDLLEDMAFREWFRSMAEGLEDYTQLSGAEWDDHCVDNRIDAAALKNRFEDANEAAGLCRDGTPREPADGE